MELYEQNEPVDCQHCDHICASLAQCVPAYCTAGNLLNASFFILLLIPASVRLFQLYRVDSSFNLKKLVFMLAIIMDIMGSVKYLLDEFTNFPFSAKYLDILLFWQSYSPVITMYFLVGLFWMSLREKKGFMKQRMIWGKARTINIVLNSYLWFGCFVIAALQITVIQTNKQLIAVIASFHTGLVMVFSGMLVFSGYRLVLMLRELPESDPNRAALLGSVKSFSIFTGLAGLWIVGQINSYYIFVWAGAVNYVACQTWIISFRLLQNVMAAAILWPLRHIGKRESSREGTPNLRSKGSEEARISLSRASEKREESDKADVGDKDDDASENTNSKEKAEIGVGEKEKVEVEVGETADEEEEGSQEEKSDV